jgi:hypothetical protein
MQELFDGECLRLRQTDRVILGTMHDDDALPLSSPS